MTPWDFYKTNAGAEFTAFSLAAGAPQPVCSTPATIHIDPQVFVDYICQHPQDALVRHYEPRTYMTEAENYEMWLPSTVGIDKGNSTEYSWGVKPGTAEDVKLLLGDKALQTLGFVPATVFVKLIAFMPGHGIPWHRDSFTGWAQAVEGSRKTVQRQVLMLSDWGWGQIMQVGNQVLCNWSAGSSYTIQPGVWHLSHNHGLYPHLVASITGEIK